jgi:predicted ATP-dependent serine protease
MEETKSYGTLFGEINLLTEEHLETILNTLDDENSKFLLISAVKYAFHKGIYSIGETEVISKCIRVLCK